MFPYKSYVIITFYCFSIVCKVVKNTVLKKLEPYHGIPHSLTNLSGTLSNGTWLIRDFTRLLLEGAKTGVCLSSGQSEG